MTFLRLAVLLSIPAVVFACGDNENEPQVFRANLAPVPLNTAVAGNNPSGTATITVDRSANTITISTSANGLDNVVHAQHIHATAECPTAAADTNNDSFVDVLEGVPAYGQILLPLDSSITNSNADVSGFPQGSQVTYEQTAPVSDVENAIAPDGGLNLASRTIVIHGVEEALPASVATLPNSGLSNSVTLPVLCGTIEPADE